MIGPRVNQWLAKNAAANVAAMAVPCTPAVALGVTAMVAIIWYDPANLLVALLIALSCPGALVLTTAWAAFVGCVMGRAGMSTQHTIWTAAGGAILLAVALGVVAGAVLSFLGNASQWPGGWIGLGVTLALTGAVVALPQVVAIWLGFNLATRIVHRRIASGQWEVTRPPGPAGPSR